MPSSRSGAGGKIVTNCRRERLSATPYDRPTPQLSRPLPQESPNWFKGIIVPSARAIASGAGKILSSIFSESESSSSEDEGYASEDDVDNDNENPCDGVNKSDKENATSQKMIQYGQESQLTMWHAGTKKLIQQLIMQETFSREECDKLIEVLNSRVTSCPREEGKKSLLAGFSKNRTDHDDDIYDKAVEEAKKWFQEKKVGSSSTDFDLGSPKLRLNGLEQVDSGGGSPVDVARSYMKDRPPWASPTNLELRTPLTTTMKLFNEGTLYSVGSDSLSTSKKRNSLASGSWNIQEELRRVRSKATDDMLRTPRSKIDPALFSVAQSRRGSVGAAKVASAMGEQMMEPESLRKTEATNELIDAGVNYDSSLAGLGTRQDGKASEALPSRLATSIDGNNENLEAVQADGEYAASKSLKEHHTDPHLNKTNGPPMIEVTESVMKPSINGLPSSQASFPGVAVTSGLHDDQHNMENHDADTVNAKKSVNASQAEGNCEPLEAYLEVPVVAETDSITSGSPNSLTIQHKESPRNPSHRSPKAKSAAKQQVRRSERYNQKKQRRR